MMWKWCFYKKIFEKTQSLYVWVRLLGRARWVILFGNVLNVFGPTYGPFTHLCRLLNHFSAVSWWRWCTFQWDRGRDLDATWCSYKISPNRKRRLRKIPGGTTVVQLSFLDPDRGIAIAAVAAASSLERCAKLLRGRSLSAASYISYISCSFIHFLLCSLVHSENKKR